MSDEETRNDAPTEEKSEAKPYKAFGSKQELDEYFNERIEDRLRRKDQKLEEDRERIEREARQQALKDQENWKKLAEEHAETVSKLEKKLEKQQEELNSYSELSDRVGGLEERLKGQLKPKLETVPELFRPFVDAMTVEEQAEWFEKNADKLTATSEQDTTPEWEQEKARLDAYRQRPAGSPATGQPAAPSRNSEKDKEAIQEQRTLRISRI